MITKLWKKFLLRPWFYIRFAVVIGFVLGCSGFLYLKVTHQLSPGPLSTAHQDRPLGGVSSHAELSDDCSHCHVPVHCLSDSTCQDCHKEIAEQRDDINSLHGRLPGVSRCQACHPEHNGEQADLTELAFTNVDHYMLAEFDLKSHTVDYAGEQMTCKSCHSHEDGSFSKVTDCLTCHSNNDHDGIAAHIEEFGSSCTECHDGQDRMVQGFEHDQFALTGGHANQNCADCHSDQHYVNTDATCSACHAEPEVHAGQFGVDCIRCHTDAAWTPAELRIHAFSLDHGDEPIETCEECHVGAYTEYTCNSCHDEGEMATAHVSLDTRDIQGCADCHPSGGEDETPLQARPQSEPGNDLEPQGNNPSIPETGDRSDENAPETGLANPEGQPQNQAQNNDPVTNQDNANESGKDK